MLRSPDPAARAAALEHVALALGRLDAALDHHPLLLAWQHAVRLEAACAHAGLDGAHVEPQRLAALIEGLRLRPLVSPAAIERGADLDALHTALALYGLMTAAADRRSERDLDDGTDARDHRRLVDEAMWILTRPAPGARLPALAQRMRAWIADDRPRGAVRAALPAALQATGMTRTLLPILAGAGTLHQDSPMDEEGWVLAFARSLEREVEDGLAMLRRLEQAWRAARAALGPRRSTSRLPAAVDLLAAAPLLGPARLASLLGCSLRGAGMMLAELADCGAVVEVTGRGSHRLYGLPGQAGILAETAGPRRHGSRRGRPPTGTVPERSATAEPPAPAVPASVERMAPMEIDYAALDALIADTNRVIERVQRRLTSR